LNEVTAPPSDVARPRGRYAGYTRARLAAFARRLRRAIHPASAGVDLIEMTGPVGRIGFEEAAALPYHAVEVGEPLGPLWATYWFRVTASVSKDWAGARVDLRWDSASEAMLWLDGRSARGLNIDREDAPLVVKARGGESLTFHVEVACNRAFGADHGGGDGRGSRDEGYALAVCELRRFDADAWRLFHDFEVLRQLEADRNPPQTSRASGGVASPAVRPALDTTWAGRLLHDLNRVCNVLRPEDRATWPAGQAILDALLGARNGEVTHQAFAVGHAHIDTAWLWPIEETRRKCQRTFATAVALMDEYPDFKFACSQAYQYAVIEQADPDLFARIKAKVKRGQWIPIGGSWVEPDCNLPSGESLSRQFLYGQRYFDRTFGARSTVFWNPDVFGYSGQLPQLMREAGMTRFLTQKLSWNRFTSPPHHSFRWRGLDGSEVVTHFPPADTYNGVATVEELRYHAANYKDADRSGEAMYLFGHGDGGGGPTPGMIERLVRCADLQGAPRVEISDPDTFFEALETRIDDLAIIEGELYFEYHRGTYTSQAEIKRLNRQLEGSLQSLDFLAATSALAGRPAPTRERIEGLWRVLLTNQFHDILPGSSIAEVYARANVELGDLARDVDRLSGELLTGLGEAESARGQPRPVNTVGFDRAEVALDPDCVPRFIRAPAFAAGTIAEAAESVRVTRGRSGEVRLENGRLTAILTAGGALKSLIHHATGRESLSGEGNRIVLFEDRPTAYEAWDVDPFALETARDAPDAHTHEVVARGPLRAEVRFERRLGAASAMTQTVRLDAASDHLEFDTHLDWRERRTWLKAVFPVAVRAMTATYETAFGAVERPTHDNTDADLARYEVPAHRWTDLAEPGFGVSLLSDARYGFSVHRGQMALSLARGPMSPDRGADIGEHRFRYGLFPHAGDWRAAGTVGRAACFNRPILWMRGEVAPVLRTSVVQATPEAAIIDTIKPAEDGQGWVVRLYESGGGRTSARLVFGPKVTKAWLSNTLEDRLSPIAISKSACQIPLRGFQIVTIRLI